MAIIGISGKINVGKDAVGKIIQYLSCGNVGNVNVKNILDTDECDWWLEDSSEWEIWKFADKLKFIVCLFIGCTREQLEDRDFKEKELGEEWNLYSIRGKNGELFAIKKSKESVERVGYSIEDKEVEVEKMTPRKMLQLMGTECGRNIIHPNIWVNSLFADMDTNLKVIITDTRFPNEADAIKQRGGILIRVNRFDGLTAGQIKSVPEHPSETALDDYKDWDYIVDNNGTIDDLVEKVREVLIKEKLL